MPSSRSEIAAGEYNITISIPFATTVPSWRRSHGGRPSCSGEKEPRNSTVLLLFVPVCSAFTSRCYSVIKLRPRSSSPTRAEISDIHLVLFLQVPLQGRTGSKYGITT